MLNLTEKTTNSLVIRKFLFIPALIIVIFILVSYSFLPFNNASRGNDFKKSLANLQEMKIKNGDLIFRRGISLESQIVLLSDRESEYSHVGIIYLINDKPYVIHSVPAEDKTENDNVRLEKLEKFLSEDRASKFALYRLKDELNNKPGYAASFAYDCYLHNYSFDNDFDLVSNSKLYCTELVWKAFKSVGVDLVENRYKSMNFIMINKKMIMPSSLIQSKQLKNIYFN